MGNKAYRGYHKERYKKEKPLFLSDVSTHADVFLYFLIRIFTKKIFQFLGPSLPLLRYLIFKLEHSAQFTQFRMGTILANGYLLPNDHFLTFEFIGHHPIGYGYGKQDPRHDNKGFI